MNVSDLIDPSFSYRLIATLVHFLWQGCLVGLITIPVDWLLRHAPASRRYVLHVTALTIMVACVAVTFLQIESPVSGPAILAEYAAITPVTDVVPPSSGAVDPADLSQVLPPAFVSIETPLPGVPDVDVSREPVAPHSVRENHPLVDSDSWREFQRWAPQMALCYFACCALLLARLVCGTWVAHRLRRTATPVSDDSIIAMLHRQSKQLGLRVIPRVAWCAEVSIPLVIGVFKPMVLLPAASATGLSPDQLQALITHELAHIYRYDLLVNLLQRIVESMLFFHPVVWYISRRISSEREHACDEMVLATGCERLRYADALVRMAELSTSMRRPGQSAPATSLAAAGTNSSEFKRRVLKVLSVPTTSQLRPSRIALLVVLTLILGAALFASRRQFNAHAETLPAPTETETTPPSGLEFLKPYPKLHGLSLDMTESQFLEIIKQQDLKSRRMAEAGKVTHRITLGDDHTLIVMFDKDGKCGGILRVRGEDDVADEPASALTKPQGKESQSLFQKWQRTARTRGDIPGGAIRPLVRVMTNFVKNNPTHEGSPKFAELLKRIDVTRDWSRNEAVKLLDEVTAIYPSLPEWVEDEPRFTLGGDVVSGKPLPDDLKDVPWGEAQPNGLRAAWLLEPRGNEYRLNTPLKSRVLFHNSGKNAVVFRALTWNQSGEHKAHDAQGQEINIFSTWWTTIPRTFVCRLAPGEFIEVIGAGIGVGQNKDDEDWRDARSDVRVGSWIEAKVGDDVTFTPAAIDGDGRESARPDDDEAPATPKSWWLKFIKDRLSLDAPLPADANERGLLLERAVRDLFGNAPTNEEFAEFKSDTTPGAFEALAKRLAERTGFETFSGMLTSGPTKFKVLPVDPDAAKKPRTAKGPGQYPLGGNTAFVVTRRPIGERIVNEARLDFAPTDATKPAPRESHPVPLPDGYDTWIAAWMRGGTVLWIAQTDADQQRSIRRYDFTDPAAVRETVITDLKAGEILSQPILEVFTAGLALKADLEFLKPYPNLHGLSLRMTEAQFLEIVTKQGIKTARNVDGVAGRYHVSTGDEHTLIVTFDKVGNCIGIQRVRGEEKRHAMEVRFVGGPKNEPLPKVNVEFTSGHGSDRKSFGTFTTDDAGSIRASLPVGFYYLHLSSEQERPYLTFEKFWTGDGQGLSRSLNVRVTETEVEKWLDGKRRESGFEPAAKDRPARITFTLEPAIELVLRAIDLETGKGIPGVEFYEEVAAGEDWAHPIYAENIGTKFTYHTAATKEQKNLTDNEGYLRRWISEKTEQSKFGAWTMPGYELIEPKGEISLPGKLGQKRVVQNFKFRRVQQVRSKAPKGDVPRVRTKPAVLLSDHWIMQTVEFDNSGRELVTASNQSFITIRRWDVIGMKLISEIKLYADKHGRPFREGTMKFSGDRKRVIGATDAYVGIWDAVTGKLLKQLPFKAKEGIYDCVIDKLDCTPDLSVIVGHRALPGRLTLSYDAHVIVWDGITGNVLQTVVDKGATDLKAIDLSSDGKRLVTTNGNGAKIWDTSTAQLIRSIPNDNSGEHAANQQVNAQRPPPNQYANYVWSVQFSPDGKQLALGDILGVKLIDAVSGTLLRRLEGPYRYSSSASPRLVFSNDSELLARLGTQEEFQEGKHRYVLPIWSTRTGARLFELSTEANDAAFSDDSQQLTVAFSDMQQALSVWSLNSDAANVEQPAGPGPHSRQDRVEENGHYVGKVAAEFIDKFKPSWGEPRLGLQYGIALTKPQRSFRIGERVPLVVFFRNTSDKPVKFNTAPDFFGNTPELLNAKGERLHLENVALLGHIPHYHETLQPGEALGPFYLSFGLGENPRPGQQHWYPYLKTAIAGDYNLLHSVSVNVAGTNPEEAAAKDRLISTRIEFEIVD